MDRPTALLLAVGLVLASSVAVAPVARPAPVPARAAGDAGEAHLGAGLAGAPSTAGADAAAPPTDGGPSLAPPVPTENSTARLALPTYRIERTGFTIVDLGMGTALQVGTYDARGRHYHVVVRRRLAAADNTTERATVVDRSLIELRDRVQRLEARERAAVTAHNEGRISTETLVERLARIHVEAGRIGATLDTLRSVTESNDGLSYLRPGVLTLEARVETLQGPVRERVARSLAGERPPVRVYAETAQDGLVLAMLTDGTYVREATLYGNWNPADGTIDNADAFQRVQELYPWAFENAFSTSLQGFGREVYRIALPHPQGELVAYMDGDTEDIYREVQHLSVQAMPTVGTLVREREQARIVFRRTYAGGPLEIRVENPTTDAAIDARVSVNGHAVGRTEIDGTVTTLQPRPPYNVTVSTEEWTYNLTVTRPKDERIPE